MIEAAPNWKGEYLPHGAAGMPANHPNVFSFAPRLTRRGFSGLGQTLASNVDPCSGWGGIFNSECWTELFAEGTGQSTPTLAAGPQVPASAAAPPVPVLTSGPGVGTPIPNAGASASDYGSVASSVANATVNALNQAIQAGTPCPNLTSTAGVCCAAGQVLDANGNCSTPFLMPWWAWAALAVGGVVILAKGVK